MHPQVERQIRDLEDQIERIRRYDEIVPFEMIEGMFPEGRWVFFGPYDASFKMPLDFALIRMVRNVMAFTEYELTYDEQAISGSTGTHSLRYKAGKEYFDRFTFYFTTVEEGTTCVMNKIAETTKVVDVYEIVCSEAAVKEFTYDDGA